MNESDDAAGGSLTLTEVASVVGGRVAGDDAIEVRGVAPLDQATADELGFLAQRRYLRFLSEARCKAVLVAETLEEEAGVFPGRIVVDDPHQALPPLLNRFHPPLEPESGIHPTAVLGKGVVLGEGIAIGPYAVLEAGSEIGDRARIGPHCVVGRGSVVGAETVLHPQVVLYPGTRLGRRVVVHSGVRLGVDGFGFVPGGEAHRKVPQVGACVIEDDVEIGANSTVDRGSIGRTVVGEGTKLDNHVHLGHNVQVGRGVLMAAMVGVSGSTRIGEGALFGGQAGINGHIQIGEGARIGGQAGVVGDVPPGETVSGYPARSHRDFMRAMAALFRLPKTLKRLEAAERRLREAESGTDE